MNMRINLLSACESNVHKTCIDDLEEPCRKRRVKSKIGNIGNFMRPTSSGKLWFQLSCGKDNLDFFKFPLSYGHN